MSLSQLHRDEGNRILLTVKENLSPVLWEGRVTSALTKYQAALNTATNKNDKASAAKNYAVVSQKLANFHSRMVPRKWSIKRILYQFREAIKHYYKASNEGYGEKSQLWLKDIQSKLSIVIQEAYDFAKCEDLGHGRIHILDKILEVLEDDHFRGECCIEIAQVHFKIVIVALDRMNFREALSHLKECYQPVEEARMCAVRSNNSYVLSEIQVLEQDILLQTCFAESIQARVIGE